MKNMTRMARMRALGGMSLDDLAVITGKCPAHLSRIERGIYRPRRETAERIAAALGAEIGELWPLLFGEPEGRSGEKK